MWKKRVIDRSTLAEVVRRLVKRGWLHRRRSRDDARAYVLKLTDEGRATLKAAVPRAQKVDTEILKVLSEKHADAFIDRLQSVLSVLEQKRMSSVRRFRL